MEHQKLWIRWRRINIPVVLLLHLKAKGFVFIINMKYSLRSELTIGYFVLT
jgi:hypothetical protein